MSDNSEQAASTVYSKTFLPGGRYITTPHGSTQVFEFGPEDGQKVLLVHGISTPCISLSGVAKHLVKRNCRVLMFDLYGRGFSEAPIALEHTTSLYTTQILSVLASSPLPWTGDNAFCLIGYSLGGGIAASFTDMFPNLVKALVLITPAGLIREHHNLRNRQMLALTSWWMPEAAWKYLMNRRRENAQMSLPEALGSGDPDDGSNPDGAAEEIITGPMNNNAVKEVIDAVKWQVDSNQAFTRSFISTARFGPISGETETWQRIGARLDDQKTKTDDLEAQRSGLVGGKILVMLGTKDSIILRNEVEPDLKAAFGKPNVKMAIYDAGHDLPVQMSEMVTEKIWETWKELGVVA